MRRRWLWAALAAVILAGSASAQFGGIVYDPTNYHNALLRYYQLEQQLAQLKSSYSQLVAQYDLALEMAQNLKNMPARYQAQFSSWRNATAQDSYGNTTQWLAGINSGTPSVVASGYRDSTTRLLPYSSDALSSMSSGELSRVRSQYATVELADGANLAAIEAIGGVRASATGVDTQVGHLEQDSFSGDPSLNSELSVLNKINAAGVLTLRTIEDSNKLLASLLEEQTILAKQQREATTNTINTDIERRAGLVRNMSQAAGTLTDSLRAFRMP